MSTTFSPAGRGNSTIGWIIALIVLILCVALLVFPIHKTDPFVLGCTIALAIARLL